jgi:hypothetical protein
VGVEADVVAEIASRERSSAPSGGLAAARDIDLIDGGGAAGVSGTVVKPPRAGALRAPDLLRDLSSGRGCAERPRGAVRRDGRYFGRPRALAGRDGEGHADRDEDQAYCAPDHVFR